MNRNIFVLFFCLFLSSLHLSLRAQSDPFAYAITAMNKGETKWIALRKINLQSGSFSNIIWNVEDTAHGSIAALAYDRRGNKLFYTFMNNDQLHYIDLFTMQAHAVPDQYFSKAGNYISVNAGPVNRMALAPDDYGYTITNDGNHLLKFNTQGSPVIRDMGDLVDDPLNKENTIHSMCANSGGDLIADNIGNLILITGNNRVYKINTTTKVTTYQATITGLPQKFTTSGIAVSENENEIIASSATYANGLFAIDTKSWTATGLPTPVNLFESSDLANSNILNSKTSQDGGMIMKNTESNHGIRLYPNPVLNEIVHIQFSQLPPGRYTIQLEDLFGVRISEQQVALTGEIQTETLDIPFSAAQAFYYVRILDARNTQISIQKLVVEKW